MIANVNRAGKGFTLTELLVVISVIIILMSMLVAVVDGLYTYAVRLQCQNRMEQLWNACLLYSNKNRILPSAWDFDHGRPWYAMLVANGYLDDDEVCNCPSSDLVSTYGAGTTTVSGSMPVATELAIHKALDNLKATQQSTGGWIGGRGTQNCGSSGLAVLAFLGFGVTETAGKEEFRDVVTKGLDYIMGQQTTTGTYTGIFTYEYTDYTQGICTMALCDAYAMGITRTEEHAQRAFDLLLNRQDNNTYGGFFENGYNLVSGTQNDNSACSWGYQGIASARHAGFYPTAPRTWETVDQYTDEFFRTTITADRWYCSGCAKYIRTSEIVDGKHDIAQGGCGSSNLWHGTDDYRSFYRFKTDGSGAENPQAPERMTAGNLAGRLLNGHRPTEDHNPRTYTVGENAYNQLAWMTGTDAGQTEPRHLRLAKGLAIGGVETWGFDIYTNYYLSLSLWVIGGDAFKEWNDAYIDEVIARQSPNGSYSTGYVPYCPSWGAPCYPPALAAISMEVSVGQYIQGSKYNVSTAGEHSYGYNKQIANDENGRRKPAGDTIVIMDYMLSGIDPADDPAECIAPRHGGKANVLFGDGHVEALAYEALIEEDLTNPAEPKYRIKSHMLSLQPGSDPVSEPEH